MSERDLLRLTSYRLDWSSQCLCLKTLQQQLSSQASFFWTLRRHWRTEAATDHYGSLLELHSCHWNAWTMSSCREDAEQEFSASKLWSRCHQLQCSLMQELTPKTEASLQLSQSEHHWSPALLKCTNLKHFQEKKSASLWQDLWAGHSTSWAWSPWQTGQDLLE